MKKFRNNEKIINFILGLTNGRFVNLTYQNKQGEIAKHTLQLGVSFFKLYRNDLKKVKKFIQENSDELLPLELTAIREIETSLTNALKRFTVKSGEIPESELKESEKTQFDSTKNMVSLTRNIKYLPELNQFFLHVYRVRKTILKEGDYQPRNKREKTKIKDRFKKNLNLQSERIRHYYVSPESISRIAGDSKTVEVEVS